MSEVGAHFICFNLRGSMWYTYSQPLSAERRSSIDWSHRFAPLLWFLNNYCTHISWSQPYISLKSWWWSTFMCTKDWKKYTDRIYNVSIQVWALEKINRGSWMQKKGVFNGNVTRTPKKQGLGSKEARCRLSLVLTCVQQLIEERKRWIAGLEVAWCLIRLLLI